MEDGALSTFKAFIAYLFEDDPSQEVFDANSVPLGPLCKPTHPDFLELKETLTKAGLTTDGVRKVRTLATEADKQFNQSSDIGDFDGLVKEIFDALDDRHVEVTEEDLSNIVEYLVIVQSAPEGLRDELKALIADPSFRPADQEAELKKLIKSDPEEEEEEEEESEDDEEEDELTEEEIRARQEARRRGKLHDEDEEEEDDDDDDDDPESDDDDDRNKRRDKRTKEREKRRAATKTDNVQDSIVSQQVLVNRWVEKCYEELKRPKSLLRLAKIGLTQPRAGEAFSDMIHELRTGQGIGNPHHPVPLIPKSVQTKSGNQLYTMALRTVGRRLANEMEQLASEAGVQLTR